MRGIALIPLLALLLTGCQSLSSGNDSAADGQLAAPLATNSAEGAAPEGEFQYRVERYDSVEEASDRLRLWREELNIRALEMKLELYRALVTKQVAELSTPTKADLSFESSGGELENWEAPPLGSTSSGGPVVAELPPEEPQKESGS